MVATLQFSGRWFCIWFVLTILHFSFGLSIPECKTLPYSANSVLHVDEFSNLCVQIASFSAWDIFYIFSSVKMNISSIDQPYVMSIYRLQDSPRKENIFSSLYSLFVKSKFTKIRNASFNLNPYENSTVMVENGYGGNRIRVETKFTPINYAQVLCFITLFVVLYYSREIASCSLFYYVIGLTMGIFLSSLFLAYLLYVFYKKTGFASGIITKFLYLSLGIVSSLYLRQIWLLIFTYPMVFSAYIGITSFISLATVYYLGPIKDRKIINILIVSLRVLSLVAIFAFSNSLPVTFIWISVLSVFLTLRRTNLKRIFGKLRRRQKADWKPREFVTLEEYEEFGKSYTESALEELREQLAGEGSSVRRLAKLKDPLRVLSFAAGGAHLSETELSYRSDVLSESYFSDDKEDIDERSCCDSQDSD